MCEGVRAERWAAWVVQGRLPGGGDMWAQCKNTNRDFLRGLSASSESGTAGHLVLFQEKSGLLTAGLGWCTDH